MVFSREELIERSLEYVTRDRRKISRAKQLPLFGAKYEREVLRVEAEHSTLINEFRERFSEFSISELERVEIGESDPSTHLESGSTSLMRAYTDEGYLIGTKKMVLIQDDNEEVPLIHKTFFMQFEEFIGRNSGYILAGLGLNDSFADFDYRSKLTQISIAECAWLVLGLKPSGELVDEDYRPSWKDIAISKDYIDEVDRTLELFERNFGKKGALSAKTAPVFLAWLETSGFESHQGFIPMINKIIANKIAITEVMPPLEEQALPFQPHPKEFDSVARILTAMAMDKYNYDPTKARSDTYTKIERMANELGFKITAETVRTYLKRGARLLENDNKAIF